MNQEILEDISHGMYIVCAKDNQITPTYIAEQPETKQLEEKEVWVCGYVHDGPISQDFICSICGMPYKFLKKINKTSIK